MNVGIESILVGLFSMGIYVCFQSIHSFPVLLFVVGMIKHYMGYWLGLQQFFCEQHTGFSQVSPPPMYEVIAEGIAFVLVGSLLSMVIRTRWILFGMIGISLHLISEVVGIHAYFLKRCTP